METTPLAQASELPDATPAKWPTVWGVLLLVWAALTLLGSCCGGMGVWLAPYFAQLGGMKDFPKAPPILSYWMIADAIVCVFLVVALVMGGMALFRRRPAAQKLVLMYVVVRLLYLVPQVVVGIAVEKPVAEWQRQMASAQVDFIESRGAKAPPELVKASQTTEISPLQRAQTFGFAALGAAFPLVAGIFFSRKSIKDQMSRWGTQTA